MLLFCLSASAQTRVIDSLKELLNHSKQDTTKIQLNYSIAAEMKVSDPAAADKFLQAGYSIARSDGSIFFMAKYFLKKGDLLYDLTKYQAAILYYDSAIALYDRLINSPKTAKIDPINYLFEKTKCLIGLGLTSSKLYHFHESTQYLLKAIVDIENLNDKRKKVYLGKIYADIASNYYDLEEFENSLKYDKLGLPYLDRSEDEEVYVVGHLFVADDFSALSQFDSSSAYLEKMRPIVIRAGKPNLDVRFYYILGGIYRKQKEWNKALAAYEKANEAAKKLKDNFQIMNSDEGIAAAYFKMGELTRSREVAISVLDGSKKVGIPFFRMLALQLLTEIEEKSGNVDMAFQYQKQFVTVSDSVKKERVQHQMNETEARYQNIKNEKEIIQLQKDKQIQTLSIKNKSTLNYILFVSITALLIAGLLAYRNFRNQQLLAKKETELDQQRISELEKDKKLVAVDAMLKGQEEERSRLAKDLHDGLGGLLSGVKFSLRNMKDNLIITPENMSVFERSLDMIDTSIKELRRVAHNMMPEMLTKFGLDEALREYCNTINTTKLLTVNYQSLGMDTRLDKSTEIIIYRIVQELLNNTIKHASAAEVLVQLIKQDNRLNVVVEDNGKGFDTASLENSSGAGWVNIRSRVDYLKGRVDVHSEAGKGTLVNIEFKI
jgi:signal transduction histidine kinase